MITFRYDLSIAWNRQQVNEKVTDENDGTDLSVFLLTRKRERKNENEKGKWFEFSFCSCFDAHRLFRLWLSNCLSVDSRTKKRSEMCPPRTHAHEQFYTEEMNFSLVQVDNWQMDKLWCLQNSKKMNENEKIRREYICDNSNCIICTWNTQHTRLN